MKVKVIAYSTTVLNKVVRKYMDLTPINEWVYYALSDADRNDAEYDELDVILYTGDVYFYLTTAYRKTIREAAFVAQVADLARNFPERIREKMTRGEYLTLLQIEVCKALDMDPAPLLLYREQRNRKVEEAREKEEHRKEEQRREAALADRRRLEQQQARFAAGEMIDTEDFLALCKKEQIAIVPRTLGVFRKRTMQVSLSKIGFRIESRRRDPDLKGCFKVVDLYKAKVCGAADGTEI